MEQQNNSNKNSNNKKYYKKHHRHYYNNKPGGNAEGKVPQSDPAGNTAQNQAQNTSEPLPEAFKDRNTDGTRQGDNRHRNNRHRNKNKKPYSKYGDDGKQNQNASPVTSASDDPANDNGIEETVNLQDEAEVSVKSYETIVEDNPGNYEIPDEDIFGTPEPAAEEDNEEKVEVAGIRFRKVGKIYYFAPGEFKAQKGGYAIVETARGPEFGEIMMGNKLVKASEIVPPLRPIIRIATKEDIAHNDENRKKEDEAFKTCIQKIKNHELDMKLIDAQYTFDNSKLLFYFTSAGRVDFRELVKDLASVFKTRIELRQIGIRDEAKLMGGLGICGRPLCCATFLSDFVQVSIKMAKEQSLSLNSAKISGNCGRLMCCLRYEYDVYADEIKRTPPVEAKVRTPDGTGLVTEISPLAGTLKVRLDDKPDIPPKQYNRDDVKVISYPQRVAD